MKFSILNLIKYFGLNSLLINNYPIRFSSIQTIKKYYFENNIYYDIYNDFCTSSIICENDSECNLYNNSFKKYKRYSSLTAEHICPQSFIKVQKNANLDMHNIYLTTSLINSHRKNYKYIDELQHSKNYYNNLIHINNYNLKNDENKLYIPCINTRGTIARSIIYMKYTYPKFKIEKVIDIEVLIKWYFLYPPTQLEIERNKIIKSLQGNDNIFISKYNEFKFLFYLYLYLYLYLYS